MPLIDVRRMYHQGERATPSACKLHLKGGEIVPCVASAAGARIGQFLLEVQRGHLPQAVLASVIDGEVVTSRVNIRIGESTVLPFLEVNQTLHFSCTVEGKTCIVEAGELVDFTI
jgi:hypothetical protein